MSAVGERKSSKGSGHCKTKRTALQVPVTSVSILCCGLSVEGQPFINLITWRPSPLKLGLQEMDKEEKPRPCSPGTSSLVQVTNLMYINSDLFLTSFKSPPKILPQAALGTDLISHASSPCSPQDSYPSLFTQLELGRSVLQLIPVCSVQLICQYHEARVWVFSFLCVLSQ